MKDEEYVIIDGLDENGEYSQKTVSVWDLVNPNSTRADNETRKARLAICHGCDKLKFPERCEMCGCIMRAKTWLLDATCPLNKW